MLLVTKVVSKVTSSSHDDPKVNSAIATLESDLNKAIASSPYSLSRSQELADVKDRGKIGEKETATKQPSRNLTDSSPEPPKDVRPSLGLPGGKPISSSALLHPSQTEPSLTT